MRFDIGMYAAVRKNALPLRFVLPREGQLVPDEII
jgi:hypothetical protein